MEKQSEDNIIKDTRNSFPVSKENEATKDLIKT